MTENGAKKLWCPFARPVLLEQPGGLMSGQLWVPHGRKTKISGDRITAIEDHCIGSQCMAWRWTGKLQYKGGPRADDGYCGLAVKQ